MRAPHPRWARALAVGAAVVALHVAALTLAWRPSEAPVGAGGDGRVPTVSAALLPPPERAAPTEARRPASPPVARPRQTTVPVSPGAPVAHVAPIAPAAADTSVVASLDPAPSSGGPNGDGSSPSIPADAASGPADEAPSAPRDAESRASVTAAAGLLAAAPPDTDPPGGNHWRPPPAGRMEYEVLGEAKGLSYRADAVLDWRPDGERYRLELALRAFLVGSRVQVSSGALTPMGLQPARFEDRARRERWLAFDWPAPPEPGRARTDGGAAIEGLPPGTQDRLGVFVQLGGWVDAMAPGQRWRIPVASLGRLEQWTVEVVGREPITVPAGSFDAVRLRRVPEGEQGLSVEAWYTPAIAGLPVRIVLQQPHGERVDQRLRQWRPAGTPP